MSPQYDYRTVVLKVEQWAQVSSALLCCAGEHGTSAEAAVLDASDRALVAEIDRQVGADRTVRADAGRR